jgi:hypothetical protein
MRSEIVEILSTQGAILLPGLIRGNSGDLATMLAALAPNLRTYIGGVSPREPAAEGVYLSTTFNAAHHLPLHCEMTYLRDPPQYLAFWCVQPARTGGATPLADCRRVLARLHPSFVEKTHALGIRYINLLHDGAGLGRSWPMQFGSSDRCEVESRLKSGGWSWEWLPNGALRTAITTPPLAQHPLTGENAWVSQADCWHPSALLDQAARAPFIKRFGTDYMPLACTFGDGSPILSEDIRAIRAAFEAERTTFPWTAGDLLLIDNRLVAHGREPYTGERRVLVAMADA